MTVSQYNKAVDRFSDNLYRFLLKNIRDEEKAKDLVQDTFEKLWMKVAEVNFEKVKSYLFTTGYRTMIDGIRRDKKKGDYNEVVESKLSHSDQYTDLNEILHNALELLPEIQKNVILLRDYEGYSYQEIGEITGLKESQVKVYIYRARVALKNHLVKIDLVL
jgi:RNA polymerase sigma-70 factor (ECF subfamily)